MKLPRFRFTMRWMMVAVLLLGAGLGGERMWARYRYSAQKAEGFAARRRERLEEADRWRRNAEEYSRKAVDAPTAGQREIWELNAAQARERVAHQEREASEHGESARPFLRAMRRPWETSPRPGPSGPILQLNDPMVRRDGEPPVSLGAAPILRVVRPVEGWEVQRGAPIDFVVEVEVPEGGRMPEAVNVNIIRGGSGVGEVKSKGERQATLAVRLTAPLLVGSYTVEAEAIQTIFTEPKPGGGSPKAETTRTKSPTVAFEVVKSVPASPTAKPDS